MQKKTPITIHTAKTTIAVLPRSPRHRATLVREYADRDGWAYATVRSRSGARVVCEPMNVGAFVPAAEAKRLIEELAVGDPHAELGYVKEEDKLR